MGSFLVIAGMVKPEKNWKPMVSILLGAVYILFGLAITDPGGTFEFVIGLTEISFGLGLVSGLALFTRCLIWAIKKTTPYQRLMKAMESIDKACKSVENIKKMYEAVHEKALEKKR